MLKMMLDFSHITFLLYKYFLALLFKSVRKFLVNSLSAPETKLVQFLCTTSLRN